MTRNAEAACELHVGTSGWSYTHWRERFYPKRLAQKNWLAFYQEHFSTVEINATFYRLPKASTVSGWHDRATPGFCYAVKGSRYITHIRRLRNVEDSIERVIARIEPLGAALGPILWQLPPNLERDDGLLRDFVALLPARHRHAVEFRQKSWFDDAVAGILDDANVAMVSVSSGNMPAEKWLTGGMAYLRFHGLAGGWQHDYSDEELEPWVRWCRQIADRGAEGWVYFNNDGLAHAPENAMRFREAVCG